MNRSIRSHASFVRLLYATFPKQRQALLLTASDDQLRVLCEIVYNVYKCTVPLSRYYVEKLKPYRKDIETLIDRDVGRKTKIDLLIKKQTMLPWLLKPILTLLK